MRIIEVSSKEFRERQKDFYDLADQGEKIIIKRKKQAYALIPITDYDLNFSPLMEEKINDFKSINADTSAKI